MSNESPQAIRAEALESILIEKGLLTAEAVDDIITRYSERVGPMNGARLVARAWADPEFKKQLLTDVVENTDKVHNAVVCTLCSCYPWAVLGLPPKWYKDPAYRSRIVMEPRQLLAEMGVGLGSNVEIQVWDSSAEIRYMVLPMRPPGTQNLKEEQLAELVTRDSMIGVEVLTGIEVPGELS